MSTKGLKKRLGKENLQSIIELCKTIEERELDPFIVDIDHILLTIHKYFPEWENAEELCLDAEALHQLASAIRFQSEWVKYRSTSLYTDPFLIDEKLRRLPKEEIATIFLKSWHPIVELEQLSSQSLAKAIMYWQDLVPLDKRWQKDEHFEVRTGTTTQEELLKQRIIAEEFSGILESFWQELKQKAKGKEKIDYWDFIGSETFDESLRRAYLTSFIVTYGYATLEVDRLEEMIYIKPHTHQISKIGKKQAFSLPIPITFEDWSKWKEGVKN